MFDRALYRFTVPGQIFDIVGIVPKALVGSYCIVLILIVISPYTTGLKALYDPSDYISTAQLASY